MPILQGISADGRRPISEVASEEGALLVDARRVEQKLEILLSQLIAEVRELRRAVCERTQFQFVENPQ